MSPALPTIGRDLFAADPQTSSLALETPEEASRQRRPKQTRKETQ